MLITIALIFSVLFQFAAFLITITLVRRTKFNISWIAISIGFLLMAIRRISEVSSFLEQQSTPTNQLNSWIAVAISACMFLASFYIRQIFNYQERIDKLRKENEKKILLAIITTEEKDRQSFAKELHDGLGPLLSAIKMSISAVNTTNIGDRNTEIIKKTETTVDSAIETVREISNNLTPQILDRFGITKAIKQFINSIPTTDTISIEFTSQLNDKRYSYNSEIVIYRVICELISNTLKYASATKAEIRIYEQNEHIHLFYTDNGVGFNIEERKLHGMGVSNIISRVNSIDGTIEMHSKLYQGFFVKITLPI